MQHSHTRHKNQKCDFCKCEVCNCKENVENVLIRCKKFSVERDGRKIVKNGRERSIK